MKKISTSMVVFSHRAKLQMLTQLSRQAAQQREYPNTRSMKVAVDQHKIIVMNFIERCDLLEGDGLIIDYERDQFQGKVGACAATLSPPSPRSHVTRLTSLVTRHTSHVTRHTSHVTRHSSHVTRHTSHVTRHTSHVTRHPSLVTRHTSHVTRHITSRN